MTKTFAKIKKIKQTEIAFPFQLQISKFASFEMFQNNEYTKCGALK